MSAIDFDYNLTIQQANTLSEIGTSLQNTSVKSLSEVCNNIDASWTGDNAKIYKNYLMKLVDDLSAKAKFMHDTAEALKSAAKKMQQAEDAAKQAAQQI